MWGKTWKTSKTHDYIMRERDILHFFISLIGVTKGLKSCQFLFTNSLNLSTK